MNELHDAASNYTRDEHGIIRDPGRFEGEPWYIVGLYDLDMDGFSEILSYMENGSGTYVALVDLDDELRAEIGPDAAGKSHALISVSESGFISVSLVTPEEADTARAELAAEEDGE